MAVEKEDVRGVTDVLIALVGVVVGGLGGYVLGVLRTLNERRNERRDVALTEIFKEMSLFYRSLVTWTMTPTLTLTSPTRNRVSLCGTTLIVSTGCSMVPSMATRSGSAKIPTLNRGLREGEQDRPQRD